MLGLKVCLVLIIAGTLHIANAKSLQDESDPASLNFDDVESNREERVLDDEDLSLQNQFSSRQSRVFNFDDQDSEDTGDTQKFGRQSRQYNFNGRQNYRPSVDGGRNFVGMNWFAPVAEVIAMECAATNGALDMGTCFTESSCNANGGVASGVCPTGGVCCIFPTVCGGTVSKNRTWFVNKDFPDYTREPSQCLLTIQRLDSRVRQVRLDFAVAELGDAVQGRCSRDSLTVKRSNSDTSLIPALCGDNTGQHVYVEFAYQNLQLIIDTTTILRRKWHVLITQVAPGQEVPSGCLQYYSDRAATVKSLNYNSGSYLFKGDLDYDICFPPMDANGPAMLRGCERKTADIDLRQSENDVRTRRGPYNNNLNSRIRSSRTGRSHTLPIVMTFQNARHTKSRPNSPSYAARRNPNNIPHSRSMSNGYSLISDPMYGQIDSVMSQLQSPSNSGLESLLNSKSQLDEMTDKFSEREPPSDDTYYYYYYEDDNGDFISNDLDGSENEQATDNYAVEHVHREFVVLPDGSPVPGNYYIHKNHKDNQAEQTTAAFNSDKYFHTGMIKDINDYTQEEVADTYYPTPTYFQRPTTAPVNLLKPSHPVASIMVYDPLSYGPNGDLIYADPYTQKTNSPDNGSPSQLTFNDLTTLSTINPDDEYTLKHDGVQWLFLKNDRVTELPTVLSSASKLILPHDISITPGQNSDYKNKDYTPNLVFKHPSGTVTEMHISSENRDRPREKIVTVIETGPITQNYTKIKLNDISELDKVIENVFNIVSESSEKTESQTPQFIDMTQTSMNYPQTTSYKNPDTTSNTQSPVRTTYFALSNNKESTTNGDVVVVTHPNNNGLVSEDLKLSQGYMTANDDSHHLTTIYDRIAKNPVHSTNTPQPTRFIHRFTSRPDSTRIPNNPELTRLTTRPKVTRITNRPQAVRVTKIPSGTLNPQHSQTTRFTKIPTSNRVTSSFYKDTTPAPTPPSFTLPQSPTIRYTKIKQSQAPLMSTIKQGPVTVPSSVLNTKISSNNIRPQHLYTTVQSSNNRGTFSTVQENTVPDNLNPANDGMSTLVPVVMHTQTPPSGDPFSTMLNNLGVQESTQKPLFTISTTSNGVVTTKSYTNVEEALEDLSKVTDGNLPVSPTQSSSIRFATKPYSQEGMPTTPLPSSSPTTTFQNLVTNPNINEVTIYNNEPCQNSYIKVDNVKVCDHLLRSEPIRDEAQRLFTNMERISVRSLGNSADPLRFSLTYETVCPAEHPTTRHEFGSQRNDPSRHQRPTTREPEVETINLLQYLLGWYR